MTDAPEPPEQPAELGPLVPTGAGTRPLAIASDSAPTGRCSSSDPTRSSLPVEAVRLRRRRRNLHRHGFACLLHHCAHPRHLLPVRLCTSRAVEGQALVHRRSSACLRRQWPGSLCHVVEVVRPNHHHDWHLLAMGGASPLSLEVGKHVLGTLCRWRWASSRPYTVLIRRYKSRVSLGPVVRNVTPSGSCLR